MRRGVTVEKRRTKRRLTLTGQTFRIEKLIEVAAFERLTSSLTDSKGAEKTNEFLVEHLSIRSSY